MGKSASAVRKKRPVRLRQKNLVSLHKKHIQKGAKVKDGPERVGSVGINEGDVAEMWDRRKTLKENYAAVGLNRTMNEHLNTFTGAQTSEQQRREMNLGDIAFDSDEEEEESEQPAAPATAVVAALQQGAAEVVEHNAQVGPRMTPGERKFVESLVGKHGLNYKAMAKDIKLNRSQETAGNLRRKVERYSKLCKVSLSQVALDFADRNKKPPTKAAAPSPSPSPVAKKSTRSAPGKLKGTLSTEQNSKDAKKKKKKKKSAAK